MKRRTFRVAGAGTLVDSIANELRIAPDEARAYVDAGSVYVRGRRVRTANARLAPGDAVLVVLEESGTPTTAQRERAALTVLHEDDDVLAVDKPAGVTAQPTAGKVGNSLVDLATRHLGGPAGLVHRLDRDTSGVTVFGKSADATSALAAAFRAAEVRKRYLAVVAGEIAGSGVIDAPLSRDPSRIGRWRATRAANGVPALTRFRRLGDRGGFSVVECVPETGRTHQIRAHLASLGTPIAGDALYGGPKRLEGIDAPRCLLHARALELPHPRTRRLLRLVAPIPRDLRAFIDAAGVDPE